MTSASMTSSAYTPPASDQDWATAQPASAGANANALDLAVAFAEAAESQWPRSFYYPDGRYVGVVEWNEKGPWSDVSGVTRARGGPAGLVLSRGRIVSEWGDTHRADMTFSVAKSYLSILAGVAVADGLIANLDEQVGATVKGPWFEGDHNGQITWRHLLQQSSEWDGVLWDKSDQVDHNRQLGIGGDNSRKGDARPRQQPGTHYEYNDVRVNLLALALLMRFGRPLPQVLRERIMDPIGASGEWEWHGYRTSYVTVDAQRIQSVSGGAHWGGGMLISARDHARMGLLIGRGGAWNGRPLLPAGYIREMLAPSPTNDTYGLLWWLNRAGARHPRWSERCISARGAGSNIVWIDPDRDIVAVLRWIDPAAFTGFLDRLADAFA
ncbi:MAG: serine hydrolase domain-containing protein [Hyphomicrobiaceae bacterium]